MYKTIFLDLDDTLWDFSESARLSLSQMYDRLNLERWFDSVESFINIYKVKNTELWKLYGQNQVTKEFLALERFEYPLRQVHCSEMQLAETMSGMFLSLTNENLVLIDGAIELLEYLKPKYQLAAASNGFVEAQYVKLESSGLLSYFSKIILSEEIGYQKPDIRFFEKALEITATKSDDAVIIGDNFESDVLGAMAAGIDAIYFDRIGVESSIVDDSVKSVSNLFQIRNFI